MGIFSGSENKSKLVLVFHIGSSSVGGALFWTEKSGVPKLIFSIREPITLEENINAERLLDLTLQTLALVADKVYKAGMGAPKEVFCVLSSLWYVSQTRVIKLEKNVPFILTPKFADSLIAKEKALFEEQHMAAYVESGNPTRVIELKSIKTMINGYETQTPLNQKGSELEMTIFISMSGEQILQNIEGTINKYFHTKEVRFFSSALSSFAIVRDIYAHTENFLLINVGGEVTDISMIKKNILRESASFPIGSNFMIRGVATGLGVSLPEAKSLLSLFKDGHVEASTAKTLGPVIEKLKTQWLLKFQESVANLSNDISVPSTIYLSTDKEIAGFFAAIIKNEQFNQYTLTESKFKVIFLGEEVFQKMAVFDINLIRDPGIITDAIYINRFLIKTA